MRIRYSQFSAPEDKVEDPVSVGGALLKSDFKGVAG